mmetsp:Transcript_19997/g.64960  ORF Transcript_19997/g.64960 Transcript_19997/m.64960 type:complete len:228 (+) Transcript_19997:583-1266(+)
MPHCRPPLPTSAPHATSPSWPPAPRQWARGGSHRWWVPLYGSAMAGRRPRAEAGARMGRRAQRVVAARRWWHHRGSAGSRAARRTAMPWLFPPRVQLLPPWWLPLRYRRVKARRGLHALRIRARRRPPISIARRGPRRREYRRGTCRLSTGYRRGACRLPSRRLHRGLPPTHPPAPRRPCLVSRRRRMRLACSPASRVSRRYSGQRQRPPPPRPLPSRPPRGPLRRS